MGFTNLDKGGMLTFGFDELPTIATIYNYLITTIILLLLDLLNLWILEYEFTVPDAIPEKVTAYMDVISKRYGVRVWIRSLRKVCTVMVTNCLILSMRRIVIYMVSIAFRRIKQYYIRNFCPFIKPDFVALVVNDQNKWLPMV